MIRARLGLLALALCGCAAAGAFAADDAPQATLKWKSKDDAGLYGYLVYRSDKREGPFLRISGDVVRVTAANDEGIAEYVWADTDVVPGHTYYYYLDTLGRDGRKARFSGVVAKTVAKP